MASCTKERCHQPQKETARTRVVEGPKPLPAQAKAEMTPTLGCDLSHVQIHNGAKGEQVAEQHNARAVTLGGQIYFGRGEYQPKSSEGQQVLTHEVAHAIQQTKSGPVASTANLESEAQSVASGEKQVPLSPASPNVPLTLRRGERPTGPPSRAVARSVRRQLDRDPSDRTGGARAQLDTVSPRVRTEIAEQVRTETAPEQRVALRLDERSVQPPAPVRTGPASQEPERTPTASEPRTPAPEVRAQTPVGGQTEVRPEQAGPAAQAPRESARSAQPATTQAPSSAPASPGVIAATPMVTQEPVSARTDSPAATGSPAAPTGGETMAAGGGAASAGGSAPTPVVAAPPSPPSAPGPTESPAFQGVSGGVSATASTERTHASSETAAGSAQSAAQSPANEREGTAQANQTETMASQQANPFDRQAFKAALMAKVQEITPTNLEEADEFQDSGRAGEIRRDVSGQVQQGTTQAAGGIPEATTATPDTSAIPARVPEAMQSDEVGTAPTPVASVGAVPAARPDSQVNLDNGPQQVDSVMAQNNVTTQQLQNSNEPAFTGAVAATDQAREHSTSAPAQFRSEETAALSADQQQAAVSVSGGLQGMHAGRSGGLGQSTAQQNDARTRTEQERIRITGEITRRFGEVRTAVEGRLAQVETDANAEFDTGSETARQNFESYVGQRMDAYKDERYSGPLGWSSWLGDKLLGLPDEVNIFYTDGKDAYLVEMDGVIDRVATIVETGLTEATTLIQQGRDDIHEYVASLPESLQSIGNEAEQNLADQFSQLEQSVNDRRDQLIDSLAQRYVANVQAIDERITAMQAENRGLVDAALDAIAGVINTIRDLVNTLTGVLSRAASAIGLIIQDPIGFLGNLVSAIGQGLRQFLNNIGRHLMQGLMGWLFGALASAGIQMPTTFDLRSILGLVLQVLGLTYANFRQRAVRILGEGVVRALETTAEIFQVLITEGPAGLWRWIREQFETLKEQMISQVRDFIMERVIMAGIQWILGMLNPASAFIRACLAIKDIVVFFIERGRQILDLVNAIIDSVTAIAQGNLTAAANWVENALARSVPVLISMLASLLGLGGISDRIRAIIERIQAPINRIIDSVIRGAASLVRTIGRAMGFGRQPENQSPSETVRALAATRLRERLAAHHRLSEIRTIVGGVLAELRPQGLLNLEVGPAGQDGAHPILASASLTNPVGAVVPPQETDTGESVSVAMNGIIEFASMPTMNADAEPIQRDTIYADNSNRSGSARIANERQTLGVVDHFNQPNTIVTRTWNGIRTHSQIGNQTHAEHHFISWLNSRRDIKSSMTRLDIILNPLSPCERCANELIDLVETRKSVNPGFVANIAWFQLYRENPNDQVIPFPQTVAYARLRRVFNQVQGPGSPTNQEATDTLQFVDQENRAAGRRIH